MIKIERGWEIGLFVVLIMTMWDGTFAFVVV